MVASRRNQQQSNQQQQPQQPQPSQPASGIPPGLSLYSPFPFANAGVNQQSSAIAIADDEFAWLENIMQMGDGNLQFINDSNPSPIYTALGGLTIASKFFYQINSIQYCIIFLSNGSAVQLQLSNSAQITVATAGKFNLTLPPVAEVFGAKWLLIATIAGYYIWDGAVLFSPGTIGPEVTITNAGGQYASAPSVVVSGGSGSGATASATLSNGQVSKVTITNPGTGFAFDDLLRLKLTFTGGGNTNKIAQGTAAIGLGGVVSIVMTDLGTGYTVSSTGVGYPAITITDPTGSGSGAQAAGVLNGRSVSSVFVTAPGNTYKAATVSISAPTGGGDTATAVAYVSRNGIQSISITDAGAGYNTTPTVVVTDPTGSGTGFLGYAIMDAVNGDTVASVVIVNPGSNYRDAIVNFVGGNPKVASAIPSIMPQGGLFPVSGTDLQVFKNRVWLVNNNHRYTSAPGSVTDFAASDGGIIAQNTDSFLSFALYGLKQSGPFLYEFGDSSINAISNPVSSSNSSGTITTSVYTVTNISPLIGTVWTETIQPFENAVIFTRPDGVFGVFGGQVKKISDKINNLFLPNAPAQPITPTACVMEINGIRCYILSFFITDPFTSVNRQVLICWDGKRWFIATQSVPIGIRSIAGPIFGDPSIGYVDNSLSIYQLFFAPSSNTAKKIKSKFYGADSALYYKQSLRFYISANLPLAFNLLLHSENGDVDLGNNLYPDASGPAANNSYGGRLTIMGRDAQGCEGRFLGWTLTSTQANQGKISYMGLAYKRTTTYY